MFHRQTDIEHKDFNQVLIRKVSFPVHSEVNRIELNLHYVIFTHINCVAILLN